MGLRDTLKNLSLIIGAEKNGNDLLEPLLASYGIEAAIVEYDTTSRQVILAVLISGQPHHIPIPTGRRLTRAEICRLIGTPIQVVEMFVDAPAPIEVLDDDQAQPPPGSG